MKKLLERFMEKMNTMKLRQGKLIEGMKYMKFKLDKLIAEFKKRYFWHKRKG